jgi:hypothetical protein
MPFGSIARALKAAFGFGGGGPTTISPRSRGAQYRSQWGVSGQQQLIEAIQRKQPVQFFYEDKWQPPGTPGALGPRIGNPHAIWVGTNGRTYLHLYVDPQSATATGDLPGWRTFLMDRIQNVATLELGSSFFGRPIQFVVAPGWNPSYYSQVGRPIQLLQL